MNVPTSDLSPRQQFQRSLERCESNAQFLPSFYQRFMGSSEEVAQKFASTSFEQQNWMLLRSLHLATGAAEGEPDALAELKERAKTHDSDHLNIRPELYELWLDALVNTARGFDRKWDAEVERAWRDILGFVIRRMASEY
ncbi:MAG: globin [Planctomycetota bacterium]|nr:globin [Planctomycetota bacterium]